MKKIVLLMAAIVATFGAKAELPVFSHVGADLSVGTNGIGIEAVTNLTSWVDMRAGVHIMPNFSFKTSADVEVSAHDDYSYGESMDVDLSMGRVQGSVIFNVYPIPKGSFFLAAGAYFAGNKLFKVHGHTEYFNNNGYVDAGGVGIPIDKDGNVDGGFKVKGFRPYVGLGFGRALPKRRLGFKFELGVQFEGKPEAYTNYGQLRFSDEFTSDDLEKITKYCKLYPVLSFTLTGRIF